jgi:hypothetical protein
MFENALRKIKPGSQPQWTKEELLAGFQHFKELHGRFPTAHEIDIFPYLPSARSIQRTHGGLVSLRQELLPEDIANYTLGEYRSAKAKTVFANGQSYEAEFYNYLVKHFDPIAVHEHKVIRPGNVNSDFFIYITENVGVIIDIFYAESIRNLINVVNIKLKRYSLVSSETYLVVVGNPDISTEDIAAKVANRKNSLPRHIHVITELTFKEETINALKSRSSFAKL